MSDVDESELEDLVRRAILATYDPGVRETVGYVDVHYQSFDDGNHLLRARAPKHALLAYERWFVVGVAGKRVHLRGGGQAGPTEFYVRARLEES